MQPKCAHIHGGLQGSELHTGSPGAHPTIRIARVRVWLSDLERGEKKKVYNHQWLIVYVSTDACRLYVLGFLFFPPSLPSFTYLRAPEVGPANQVWNAVQRNAAARMEWDEGCSLGAGPAGTPSPQEATGGSCGSAQGCQSRRGGGGGEGGKYTVAKRWWKGKGRFYKFLNFMTMLQQCNVHSICCEVSTENMHWAY